MSITLKPHTEVQPAPPRPAYASGCLSGDSGQSLASSSLLPERTSAYIAELSRKQNALARIVREEPPTPPHSPLDVDEGTQEERINALRERAQEAWVKADGNPADGKWIFLTHLLRMGATSGRRGRWIGARTDVKPPEELQGENMGWLNAETECEWQEWEQRDRQERNLKDKVESWKRKLEAQQTMSSVPGLGSAQAAVVSESAPTKSPTTAAEHPANTNGKAGSDSDKNNAQTKAKITAVNASGSASAASKAAAKPAPPAAAVLVADPLKDTAPFGFSVVKRPTTQKSATGKPNVPGKQKPSNKSSEPEQDNSAHASQAKKPTTEAKKADKLNVIPASTRNMNIRHIADLTEHSFLPPSFPSSAIVTSTPKAAAKLSNAQKPESIPHVVQPPFSSSFLPPFPSSPKTLTGPVPLSSSPRVTKTYGRHNNSLETSASLPVIPTPSTPTRNTHHNHNHKPTSASQVQLSMNNDDHDIANDTNANNKRERGQLASPGTPNDGDDSRVLKKARTLPAFTFTSPRSPSGSSPRNRRALPQLVARQPSSPHTPKGPRTAVPPAAVISSPPGFAPAPVTPKKQALPTLMELLATSKKGKTASPKKTTTTTTTVKPSSKGKERQQPILDDQDQAEKRNLQIISFLSSSSAAAAPAAPVAEDNDHHGGVVDASFDDIVDHENPYMLDPYAISVQHDLDLSPTKSLSSLAGSDSEDDIDEEEEGGDVVRAVAIFGGLTPGFSFKPLAASTQRGPFISGAGAGANTKKPSQDNQSQATPDSWASVYASPPAPAPAPRPPPSSNTSYPYAYNSQFESDVARQVDKVDKLLEKDVDYEGWLKDPSEELEGGQNGLDVEDSP